MNSKGILVNDRVYCLNVEELTFAKELAERFNLELECYGYQFERDMLEWQAYKLVLNTGDIALKFKDGKIVIVQDASLYEEDISYMLRFTREVASIECMNIILRYIPYRYLTGADLTSIKKFINYNLPNNYRNENGTVEICYYNSSHGTLIIDETQTVKISNEYGTTVLPKELAYIAKGRTALDYLVEGRYRLDTILHNNKKAGDAMLINEIIYDTRDMLKINEDYTKGENIALGIDPDSDAIVLVNLDNSDIIRFEEINNRNILDIIENICNEEFGIFTIDESVLDEFLIAYVMPEEVLV